MNILHHKSWHVYSQKNKDKVQEDEAKAATEEKIKEVEQINKERSDRLSELRKRASSRYSSLNQPESVVESPYSNESIDLTSHSHKNETLIENFHSNKRIKYENKIPASSLSNSNLASMLREENSKKTPSPIEESDEEEAPHPLETYDLQKDLLKNLTTEIDLLEKKKDALNAPKKTMTAPKPAITNTFLTKHDDPTPWYVQKDDTEYITKSKSSRFKDFNDPLRDIKKELSTKPHSQNKPEKKSSYGSSHSQNIKSLRAQRILRESQERERERKILSEVYSKQGYGYDLQNKYSNSVGYRKESSPTEGQSYSSKKSKERKKKSKSKKKKFRHSDS